MAAAHERGARVTAHVFGEEALPDLIEAGIDCIEHGTGLSLPLIDTMAANGVALVPTVVQLDNFPKYAAAGRRRSSPAYAAHMLDLWERRRETIGAAYEAGVPIYAGTDAGGVLAARPHRRRGHRARHLRPDARGRAGRRVLAGPRVARAAAAPSRRAARPTSSCTPPTRSTTSAILKSPAPDRAARRGRRLSRARRHGGRLESRGPGLAE